jgi:membrane-anchored protein YejM (alkaline phosphatase superfamily)
MRMDQSHKNSLPRQVLLFAVVNMLVSGVITAPLFWRGVAEARPWVAGNLVMFLSTAICLNAVCLVVPFVLAMAPVLRIIVAGLSFLLAAALQLFLITDVRVFSFFKFHINALVINFLTTEGASDSLRLGMATWATYLVVGLLVIGGEMVLAGKVIYKGKSFSWLRFEIWPVVLGLLLVVLADKGLYAYADLTNRAPVLSLARFYPLYGRITVKHLAEKWFGYRLNREKEVALSETGKSLKYPLAPLTFSPNSPRYNVVLLAVEAFRWDMLTPEVTPHLDEFAQQNIRFVNHFSGGNGTRFGLFSMLYGLYGSLWHPFLAARQGPVLIDALRERDYRFLILSSTRLTFPEFRKTAFIKIPESILDEHAEPESWKRDRVLIDQFHQFLDRTPATQPFFGFVFFNSSHPFYQYPKEFEKFGPVTGPEVNYMSGLTPSKVQGLKNRYKNALYYEDALVQQVIDDLKQHGMFDNTILIIAGDHGEEFAENGYFSHNSAFDDYQIKSALVMKIPGVAPQTVTNMTSHLDFVPTILTLLGCTSPPATYSHGRYILSTEPRSFVFSSDWSNGAIVTVDERAVVPVSSSKVRFVEVRTARDYKLVDDKETQNKFKQMMLIVAKDLAVFLR